MKHADNQRPQATRRWPAFSEAEAIEHYHRLAGIKYNQFPDKLDAIRAAEKRKRFGHCPYCKGSGMVNDFEVSRVECAFCSGTGTK